VCPVVVYLRDAQTRHLQAHNPKCEDGGVSRRVVVVSDLIPYRDIPHAGGRYLSELVSYAQPRTDFIIMAPGNRVNRGALQQKDAPANVLLVGGTKGHSLLTRAEGFLAANAESYLRRWDPGMPNVPLWSGLFTDHVARDILRSADVIDLQWTSSIRLVATLRRLNPQATFVGTFHDVQSQLFAREPRHHFHQDLYWRQMERWAKKQEQRCVRQLDHVLAFSNKDLQLLGWPSNGLVVRPPLAPPHPTPHSTPHSATHNSNADVVLVVSYLARPENEQGIIWLINKVWPRVRAGYPQAELRLVGAGANPNLTQEVANDPSVTLAGFVPDLVAEYQKAAVCAVPLHQGAGVKFKTIEALVYGVPTVTTSVGAEGIEGPHLFAACTDDAARFAAGLLAVLTDPKAAQKRADAAQSWAARYFGTQQFEGVMTKVWGLN
jgi:glycosyltransferase involved in cell wall biosynthesis